MSSRITQKLLTDFHGGHMTHGYDGSDKKQLNFGGKSTEIRRLAQLK